MALWVVGLNDSNVVTSNGTICATVCQGTSSIDASLTHLADDVLIDVDCVIVGCCVVFMFNCYYDNTLGVWWHTVLRQQDVDGIKACVQCQVWRKNVVE